MQDSMYIFFIIVVSLFLKSKKEIKVDVQIKPLFSLDDNHVVIKFKEGEEVFNLKEITNVRFQKERNLIINIIFLFFTLLTYSIISDYFDYFNGNFTYHFLSYAITIVTIIVSLSVEFYTYELYVHTKNLMLLKLKLSKKDESNAIYFASLFKSDAFKQCN